MVYDYCIIGGGIVGLATALALIRQNPGISLALIEKEPALGLHQTGHNSGVIHAGVYYRPGSLKARLCREGAAATKQFCDTHAIPYETRGKLIVATDAGELPALADLQKNAQANAIAAEMLDKAQLRALEPHVAGEAALLVRETGIVDYRKVGAKMGELIAAGCEVSLNATVDGIAQDLEIVTVTAGERSWQARKLVVCGGLQSDRLARLSGMKVEHQIIPFRGEYYQVSPGKSQIVRHLIYPVPDPNLPFLGIHLTPMIGGELTVGPNAVLGFAREKYAKYSFDARDFLSYLRFGGFWRVMGRHWMTAISELESSASRRAYLRKCQKYCPDLNLEDLLPYRAGIRAQAVLRDGTLVHDFLFLRSDRILHVGNAPSPAATSAIPIGEMIAKEIGPAGN